MNVKRYFVRVQVYHRGDGVLLGIADSRPDRRQVADRLSIDTPSTVV